MRTLHLRLLLGLAIGLTVLLLAPSTAHAASFDPTRIIDDAVFYNSSTMSVAEIQNFLNTKVPVCDSYGALPHGSSTRAAYSTANGQQMPFTCLKGYYENPTTHANNLYGGAAPAGSISAAEIIYNAAQTYGINPQVLLITLQKENGLITDDWPWTGEYNTAMGFGCPDSGPNNSANCNSQYYGFYNQVFLAAKQFRIYANSPNSFNFVPGPGNFVKYNPNAACSGTTLNIQNQATASLYDYTPYQPNAAALAAGYGTGDGCSAYGNRNFFNYFNDWFGSTYNQITYVQVEGSSSQYIIYDGRKQALTYDGLLAWGINRLPLTTMSATALDGIPTFPTALTRVSTITGTASMVFADGTNYYDINSNTATVWGNFKNTSMSSIGWPLVRFANFKGALPFVANIPNDVHQYEMEGGTLLPLSSPTVLHAWGGNSSVTLSSAYAQGLPIGQTLTHNLVSVSNKLYLLNGTQAFAVSSSIGNLFSSWTPYPIGATSLERYTQAGSLSYLIKSDQSGVIYAIDGTKKRPITTFGVFMALRNSASYESTLTNDAIDLLPTGDALSTDVLLEQNTTNYYSVNGALTAFPARLTSEYSVSSMATTVTPGFISLFAKNSSTMSQFVKSGNSAVVYFVSEGKRIPISRYDVMVLLNGQNAIVTLPDADLAKLPIASGSMTPLLVGPDLTNTAFVDQSSIFTSNSQQTLKYWNAPPPTKVSQATYDWFISASQTVFPLSQHVQTENGEFCNIDGGRYCAEQFSMIYNWNLLAGVIHPSNTLLGYLNISRSGALNIFVTAPSGQPYSTNVFAMVDGILYYVSTPAALSNLGFNGSFTKISAASIDQLKSSNSFSGYLFKDSSVKVWVIDGSSKRLVPDSLQANWTGVAAPPQTVSSYFLSLFSDKAALTKSITSPSTGTVYGLDNGLKRGITTYQKYLQSWSPYTSVTPPLIELIPSGSDF